MLYKGFDHFGKCAIPLNGYSLSYVEQKLFEWIKLKLLEKDSNILFMKYLENKVHSDIKPLILWIPINELFVETPFLIGNSQIIPLSKLKIDDWEASFLETSSSEQKEMKENFKIYVDNLRKKYQGLACVVTQIEAEQSYAHEYAIEQAQKITSIIGILSGAVLFPNAKSACQIKGSENIAQAITFFELENKMFRIIEGSIEKPSSQFLMINRELIQEFRNLGLNRISDLLAKDQESLLSFENKVLNFLFLYSKASFTDEPVEKIVYVLSALESILLRSDNEPIQQNLGERLAFFISDQLEERKKIIKNLRSAYSIRSKYIHHGSSSSELETIKEFLFFVFRFFVLLINNCHLFGQKEDFLNYIDDKKLS